MRQKNKHIQMQYYEKTANQYDKMHLKPKDENYVSLDYISMFIDLLSISSVLDIGCGTGRGVKFFLERYPSIKVHGIDPVQKLLSKAEQKGIPSDILTRGNGYSLPFRDGSFDVVCTLGVLHHVKYPNKVVKEMLRVANKAVFIADGNRFGQGSKVVRVVKLLLYKTGLWGVVNFIKTGGKGYTVSEDDGLAYSYSVFDSYQLLARWADRIIFIPTKRSNDIASWFHPLLTADCIMICAIRD
ncbi:MAG: class I SAM-dependent methyltransferase [Candidatus Aminicenantes bacterium]|nr:MAG: class I SAM-dependent methyltransferase [Candidatus Aminicenantes bacterium]